MKRINFIFWAGLTLSLVFILAAGVFIGLHLSIPSDGAYLKPGEDVWRQEGVIITPLDDHSQGLKKNDIVVAVEGRSLSSWIEAFRKPSVIPPNWQSGDRVDYTIIRNGRQFDIQVTLGRFPYGSILRQHWGAFTFSIVNLLVAVFVFAKRPKEQAAQIYLLMSIFFGSAMTWSVGLQVSDLVSGVGYWLYALTTTGGYILAGITLLHFWLVFPERHPILSRNTLILPAVYIFPYAFLILFLGWKWTQETNALTRLSQINAGVGYVEMIYFSLIILTAISGYHSTRNSISRTKVRWILFALLVAIFFPLLFGTLPSLVSGESLLDWNYFAIVGLLLPLSLATAVLRHNLFDIEIIINRTLVYGGLSLIIFTVYILVVASVGVIFQSSAQLAGNLLAIALVILLFKPLKGALQTGVNQVIFSSSTPTRSAAVEPIGEHLEYKRTSSAELIHPSTSTLKKWLPWSLMGISILTMTFGIGMALRYVSATGEYRQLLSHQLLVPVSTLIYAILGALVATRRPRNPLGWTFLLVGFLYSLNALSVGYSVYASNSEIASRQLASGLAVWMNTWVWIPEVILPTTFVLLFFPDGRLPSPRWRLIAFFVAVGIVMIITGIAFQPGQLNAWGIEVPNPFGIETAQPLLNIFISLGNMFLMIGFIGSVSGLLLRFRRSRGVARLQMKWIVYAVGLMGITLVLLSVLWAIWPDNSTVEELGFAMTSLVILAIAVATSIAILRYRLLDIDLIINRTLVYGALTMAVVGIYALVVGTLGIFFQASGNWIVSLLATGLAALLFQPVRTRLQRAVNRMMYGERDDPYAVLSNLGKQLEASLSPENTLPAVVKTISQSLKLPFVAIELEDGGEHNRVAAFGLSPSKNVEDHHTYPLVYQKVTIGRLILSPRSSDEAFTPAEEQLLADIARQVGAAAHAMRLTENLQRSRQRIIATREEERRRLRRDLHDGLGPQLATINLKIDAARNLLKRDPDNAHAILTELKRETKSALGDIRRIAYDLRPPALDELGLAPALREHIASINQQADLQISIQTPKNIPPLPAAVEVAAYRIAMEALTNVLHHANAHNCLITIKMDHELELAICDDGIGIPQVVRNGVGLKSMRERAVELGGKFSLSPNGSHGTRVVAKLPLSDVHYPSSLRD